MIFSQENIASVDFNPLKDTDTLKYITNLIINPI